MSSDEIALTLRLDRDGLTATIADATGLVIASADAGYETLQAEPGFAEQRPDDWWQAARTAIAALPPEAREDAGTITLAGDLRAILVLDTDHEPIRPAVLADDARATGGAASVLQWLREHQSIAYKRVRHLTTARGYVRLRLTGTLALDPEDAASTGLLDETGQHWCATRCDEDEVNEEVLPPLLTNGEGSPLTTAVAAQLGVSPSIVLTADRSTPA